MSAVSHTPGPWIIEEPYTTDVMVQGRDGLSPICECTISGIGEEQAEANARVIAAAPDLLSACRLVLYGLRKGSVKSQPVLEGLDDPKATEYGMRSLEEIIAEVVAKVDGRAA